MSVITHVALDNNSHELVFAEASRNAIDQFLGMLVEFFEASNGEAFYIVLDMRHSGMLPLRYLTKSLRRVLERYPDHTRASIAIVLEDPQLLDVTRALLRTIMHREVVQYFTQIDKAHLWLKIVKNKRR
ncbi:MAG: hypothetical protein WBC91_14890 [Phototrophicaceae bacterium]